MPSDIKEVFSIGVSSIQFDSVTKNIVIKADFNRVLNFLNGILPIQAPSIVLTVDLSVGSITGDIVGEIDFSGVKVPVEMKYDPKVHHFKIATDFSPSALRIDKIISDLEIPFFNIPNKVSSTGRTIKVIAELDGLSNGILIVGITIDPHDQVFVVFKRDKGDLTIAFVTDIARYKLSDLVSKLTG